MFEWFNKMFLCGLQLETTFSHVYPNYNISERAIPTTKIAAHNSSNRHSTGIRCELLRVFTLAGAQTCHWPPRSGLDSDLLKGFINGRPITTTYECKRLPASNPVEYVEYIMEASATITSHQDVQNNRKLCCTAQGNTELLDRCEYPE